MRNNSVLPFYGGSYKCALSPQGQPCLVNMCDSANLCVNSQAEGIPHTHTGKSSHDLGYKDPQLLAAVHTGVTTQWGEDSLVCYFASISQSHILKFQTLNTSFFNISEISEDCQLLPLQIQYYSV